MMTTKDIVALLRSRYGSLDEPDFSFVTDEKFRNPYAEIVDRLVDIGFEVMDRTDENHDVCFQYDLQYGQRVWYLSISMVGPFGLFMRPIPPRGAGVRVIHRLEDAAEATERSTVRILTDAGITLMDSETLETPVDLRLFETDSGQVTLYQALFSDTPTLPWRPI